MWEGGAVGLGGKAGVIVALTVAELILSGRLDLLSLPFAFSLLFTTDDGRSAPLPAICEGARFCLCLARCTRAHNFQADDDDTAVGGGGRHQRHAVVAPAGVPLVAGDTPAGYRGLRASTGSSRLLRALSTAASDAALPPLTDAHWLGSRSAIGPALELRTRWDLEASVAGWRRV